MFELIRQNNIKKSQSLARVNSALRSSLERSGIETRKDSSDTNEAFKLGHRKLSESPQIVMRRGKNKLTTTDLQINKKAIQRCGTSHLEFR